MIQHVPLFEEFRAEVYGSVNEVESKKDWAQRERLGKIRVDTKEKSLAFRLQDMMSKVDLKSETPETLKSHILTILDDPNLYASHAVRVRWKDIFGKQQSVNNIVRTAYNIILKSGGLGVY